MRDLAGGYGGQGIVLTSKLPMAEREPVAPPPRGGVSRGLVCRDLVDSLDEYLSGSMAPDRRAAFSVHLSQCPSCVSYMKTYRATLELGRAALLRSEEPVPDEVPEDLVRAIFAAREKA